MNTKFRPYPFASEGPSWPTIALGFVAFFACGALARWLEPQLGRFWGTGVAALGVFLLYFGFIIRRLRAPWRVVARLASIYALGLAAVLALLSLVDF